MLIHFFVLRENQKPNADQVVSIDFNLHLRMTVKWLCLFLAFFLIKSNKSLQRLSCDLSRYGGRQESALHLFKASIFR